jgi:hypothetical protein
VGSTACYGHSFTFKYVDDIRSSQETQSIPWPVTEIALLFICRWRPKLTENIPISLHGLRLRQLYLLIYR